MTAQPITEANIHNAQMLDRMSAVQRAAETLARKGFYLAAFEIGPRNPVIWVEYTQVCNSLPAGMCTVMPGGDVVMASSIDGVQVQWFKRRLAS